MPTATISNNHMSCIKQFFPINILFTKGPGIPFPSLFSEFMPVYKCTETVLNHKHRIPDINEK